MKTTRRILAVILTLAMILTVIPAAFAEGAAETKTYVDVTESDWFYDDVMFVTELEAMDGTSSIRFSPTMKTTRGMVVTVLARLVMDETYNKTSSFKDVPTNQWYSVAVAWAAEIGLAQGYPDGTFRPDEKVSRQDLAVFFYRFASILDAAGVADIDVEGRKELSGYKDADKVGEWAEDALQWATYSFVMNGRANGTMDPKGDAQRAELAAIVRRLVLLITFPNLYGHTMVMHTNDVHGTIEGYAAVTYVKELYEILGVDVVLVDAGDFSQGTTYVSTTKGMDAVDMMNAAGYAYATLGNHEFDYGYATMKDNLSKADFQVLCANVLDAEGNPVFAPSAVYSNRYGLNVGFVGVNTPESQTKANPALIKGLQFLAEDEMYKSVQDEIDEMGEAADVVIALAHLGVDAESEPNRSTDLYENVTGLDFIIDGHSHSVLNPDLSKNETPIQSTGSSMEHVGYILLDSHTGEIVDNSLIALKEDTDDDGVADSWIGIDEDVDTAAQAIIDRVKAEYGKVFAKSEVELNGVKGSVRTGETNLGNLITDSMMWAVLKDEDSIKVPAENVVAITNGGGIRASIAVGDITKNDVNTVLPFGNTVALVYVTGAELLEALEASTFCTPSAVGAFPHVAGLKFTVDTTKTYDANADTYPGSTYYGPKTINRVTITEVNGKAFDVNATYAVVTNNFLAAGGDTYYAFASATEQFDTGIPMDEALMEYIEEELNGVVGAKYAAAEGRITIITE